MDPPHLLLTTLKLSLRENSENLNSKSTISRAWMRMPVLQLHKVRGSVGHFSDLQKNAIGPRRRDSLRQRVFATQIRFAI